MTSSRSAVLLTAALGFAFSSAELKAETPEPAGAPPVEEIQNRVFEADLLHQKGELSSSAAAYREALESIPDAVEYGAFRASVAERFAAVSVAHAKALAAGGRLSAANATLDAVLTPGYAPTYGPAIALKEELQDPERYNPALTPEHVSRVGEVNRLLQQARGFRDLGLYAEALDAFRAVILLDRTNTAARRGMEQINRAISHHHLSSRDHTRADLLRNVDEQWETPVPDFAVGEAGGTFEIGGGTGDSSVSEKLNRTIIPRVAFTEATISEIVAFLAGQSASLDPTGSSQKGVNIVIDAPVEFSQRRVSLGLSATPLAEVLRYVAELAGMSYRIETYAVKLVPAGSDAGVLRTQVFKVPPTFISNTEDTDATDEADPFAAAVEASTSGIRLKRRNAKEFLEQSGITFPEGATAGFNAAASTLSITNTDANIDAVRLLVEEALASAANQVIVRVRMLETTQENLTELGYDWLLGQFNVPGSDRVFASGGTQGRVAAPFAGEQPFVPPGSDIPVGQFPVTAGNRSGSQISELSDSIDGVIMADSRRGGEPRAPGVFSLGGVLTDPQVQLVIRALNQNTGVDVSMAPEIVTRSGQRAEVSVVREFPFPTEFDPPEVPQDFGTNVSSSFTIVNQFGTFTDFGDPPPVVATPTTPTTFDVRELGASLEVEPVIGPDGKTVDLNLAPELDEFEGFINYGTPITDGPNVITENGILLPVFRAIRESLRVAVWDGQTVAIGGLLDQRTVGVDDSAPGFGDVPLLGRFFKSKVSKTETRAIVFLVSVKIIDPCGNSVASVAR